eukprot:s366_g16.t1
MIQDAISGQAPGDRAGMPEIAVTEVVHAKNPVHSSDHAMLFSLTTDDVAPAHDLPTHDSCENLLDHAMMKPVHSMMAVPAWPSIMACPEGPSQEGPSREVAWDALQQDDLEEEEEEGL